MNLVMPRLIQTLFVFGKLNSETLQTVLKLLLINLSFQEKPNGMLKMDWSCFCLTVMTELVQSILHAELKDICNFVTKMNLCLMMVWTMTTRIFWEKLMFKLLIAQLLPITSMFLGPKWECLLESLLLLLLQRNYLDLRVLALKSKILLRELDSNFC